MKTKRLKRSRSNRILTGVLGGIAEYFGINARYLRIAYIVITLLMIHTMIPVLIYLLLTVLIPNDFQTNANPFSGGFRSTAQTNQHSNGDRKILHNVEEKDEPKSKE
ncbi:PspC domain-containing protein [Nicoliella lavandulae]|uniref:PspC domain-containing protein n=1 Tax=Nicoliella lavandulae TaxID=3082954 RepID=A0ABU8SL03_9LACO